MNTCQEDKQREILCKEIVSLKKARSRIEVLMNQTESPISRKDLYNLWWEYFGKEEKLFEKLQLLYLQKI